MSRKVTLTNAQFEIEGRYQKGRASVDEFLEQVAIANPHVKLVYHPPEGTSIPRPFNSSTAHAFRFCVERWNLWSTMYPE